MSILTVTGLESGWERFEGNDNHRQFTNILHFPSTARGADKFLVLRRARQ